MGLSAGSSLWLFAIISVLYVLFRTFSHLTYTRAMRKHGCSLPRKYFHWDPILGYDLFRKTAHSIANGDSFLFEKSLFNTYGKTFAANSWGNTKIYTMDPQNMEVVLRSQFRSFAVGTLRENLLKPFMEKSVFTSDGTAWAHSRAAIRPVFQRVQVADLAPFAVHVDRFIKLLPRDGSMVDLQPLLKRLFLDRATEFVFGKSTDTLLPQPSLDTEEFLQNFDNVMRGVGLRQAYGKFTFLRGRELEWKQAIARVHAVVDNWIAEALTNKGKDDGGDQCSQVILVKDLAKNCTNHTELRSQLLNVFFPARDTSAIGVSDIFFNLARHPRVWRKLRNEVMQAPRSLTYETLKSMKYMQHALNENCILPQGGGADGKGPIFVRAGTELHLVWWASQRDQDFWGDDASVFRPERWEDPNLRVGLEFMPFLAGPRVCPAQQMVLTEAAFIVARIMQQFETLENRDDEFSFVEEHRLTMQSRNGVKVSLIPATGNVT
ncbi:MAG: hypothetical protein Q9166_006609 [cf. Caloplaca sp. 2 TL-2023]